MRHDKTSHTISWISSSVRVAPTFLKSSAASEAQANPQNRHPFFEKPPVRISCRPVVNHCVKCEQRRIERGVIKNDRVVGAVAISQKLFIGIGFVCHPGICRQAYSHHRRHFAYHRYAVFRGDATGYVTLNQLQNLYKNGHEIGNHTRTHPFLSTVSSTQLTSETGGAQQDLQTWGFNPTTFAYPYDDYGGSSTSAVVAAVKGSGVRGARDSDYGGYNNSTSSRCFWTACRPSTT